MITITMTLFSPTEFIDESRVGLTSLVLSE